MDECDTVMDELESKCCAPVRVPLYDMLLHNLMKVQRDVKRHAKLAH